MNTIWNTCEAAGVTIPEQVQKFFGYEDPGTAPGREIEIGGIRRGLRLAAEGLV
jgi:hypothetical protein